MLPHGVVTPLFEPRKEESYILRITDEPWVDAGVPLQKPAFLFGDLDDSIGNFAWDQVVYFELDGVTYSSSSTLPRSLSLLVLSPAIRRRQDHIVYTPLVDQLFTGFIEGERLVAKHDKVFEKVQVLLPGRVEDIDRRSRPAPRDPSCLAMTLGVDPSIQFVKKLRSRP